MVRQYLIPLPIFLVPYPPGGDVLLSGEKKKRKRIFFFEIEGGGFLRPKTVSKYKNIRKKLFGFFYIFLLLDFRFPAHIYPLFEREKAGFLPTPEIPCFFKLKSQHPLFPTPKSRLFSRRRCFFFVGDVYYLRHPEFICFSKTQGEKKRRGGGVRNINM